jgi:hypothetical protein
LQQREAVDQHGELRAQRGPAGRHGCQLALRHERRLLRAGADAVKQLLRLWHRDAEGLVAVRLVWLFWGQRGCGARNWRGACGSAASNPHGAPRTWPRVSTGTVASQLLALKALSSSKSPAL